MKKEGEHTKKNREEQLNLFDILEFEEKEERRKEVVREGYRIWLRTPEITPCGKAATIDYRYHVSIIHRCETMPKDVYLWKNPVATIRGGEYWVKQFDDLRPGIQMDECPYCGANLHCGQGQRFLVKASGHVYSEKSYRRYYGLDEIDKERRKTK